MVFWCSIKLLNQSKVSLGFVEQLQNVITFLVFMLEKNDKNWYTLNCEENTKENDLFF